jgi:hypothetical protein
VVRGASRSETGRGCELTGTWVLGALSVYMTGFSPSAPRVRFSLWAMNEHRRDRFFLGWAIAGLLLGFGFIMQIGLPFLIIGVVLCIVLSRRGATWPAQFGVPVGAGVVWLIIGMSGANDAAVWVGVGAAAIVIPSFAFAWLRGRHDPEVASTQRTVGLWTREFYAGLLIGLGLLCGAAGAYSLTNLVDAGKTPAWVYVGLMIFWGLAAAAFLLGARSVRRGTSVHR